MKTLKEIIKIQESYGTVKATGKVGKIPQHSPGEIVFVGNKKQAMSELKKLKNSGRSGYIMQGVTLKVGDKVKGAAEEVEATRMPVEAPFILDEGFFKVTIPDMSPTFIEAAAASAVKNDLRRKLKPEVFKELSIERVTVGEMKKMYRDMAQGKEVEEEVEIEEGAKFSAAQLDKLKAQYSTLQKIDPASPSYKKMKDMMSRMSKEQLKQIKAAKIKFLQYTAGDLLRKMKEAVEIEEEVFYWYIIKGTAQKGKVWKTGTEREMKLLLRKPTTPSGYVLAKSRKDLSSGDVWKGSMGVSEGFELDEAQLGTFKLNTGDVVSARMGKGYSFKGQKKMQPYSFTNRTQAQKHAEKIDGKVINPGRVFYVKVKEEVEKRTGPPRITNMWKRDETEVKEGSEKNLDTLRRALAVAKFKKSGGEVEKQPPGIARGAIKFRGKGGTTRDDDEEDKINRDVMSWRKLRGVRKRKK